LKTTLILDEQSVLAHDGVSFHLNPATKHPENPVMLPGEPHQWDSLQVSWPATVLYSAEEKKFRCWYSGFDVIQTPDRFWKPGYAESEDGIHWTKPNLGQVEFLGSGTNRIEVDWPYTVLSTVFENPEPDAPESKRFASYWTELGEDKAYRKGLAYSPDGMRWTRARTAYEGLPNNRASFQDISQVIYDVDESDPDYRIKAYSQLVWKRPYDGRPDVRHIGLACGRDIETLRDAEQPLMLAPEEGIDEELHFAAVKRAGGQFVMLFESDRFAKNPIHGDLKLAVSEDGKKPFRRVHPNDAVVPTGVKGFWDENLLVTTTSAIQEVGDELYIYYIGCPNTYNSWPPPYMVSPERRGSMFAPAYLGLATLKRDRYACAQGPGSVTVSIGGDSGDLWLNADGDDITVTALGPSGNALAEGRVSDERSCTVYRRVLWSKPSAGASVRVSLGDGCRLYSIGTKE